jgi:hypothetical protein
MAGEEGKGGVSFACDVSFNFGLCVRAFLTVRHCNHNVDVAKAAGSGRLKDGNSSMCGVGISMGKQPPELAEPRRLPSLRSRIRIVGHLSNSWVNSRTRQHMPCLAIVCSGRYCGPCRHTPTSRIRLGKGETTTAVGMPNHAQSTRHGLFAFDGIEQSFKCHSTHQPTCFSARNMVSTRRLAHMHASSQCLPFCRPSFDST